MAAMLYQTYTTTPLYRAQARVQIDEEQSTTQTEFKEAYFAYSDPEPYYQTQYKILERFGCTDLLGDIRSLIESAREQTARAVNSALVGMYWHIGKRIREAVRPDGLQSIPESTGGAAIVDEQRGAEQQQECAEEHRDLRSGLALAYWESPAMKADAEATTELANRATRQMISSFDQVWMLADVAAERIATNIASTQTFYDIACGHYSGKIRR